MTMSTRKYFCTFPQDLISEPIISHTLGEKFRVIPNIRAASITDAVALVAVEIEGKDDDVQAAVEYLMGRGVKVEEITEGGSPLRI
jgi:ABC-type methionine transport system ATPase subunit